MAVNFRQAIKDNCDGLLARTVVAIDPASGSSHSMPGYAVYRKGVLVESGTLKVSLKLDIYDRLRFLFAFFKEKFPEVDYFAIEKLRGGCHTYLRWSCSMFIVAADPAPVFEVAVATWRKIAGPKHVKSDENDAIAIGNAMMVLAKGAKDERDGKTSKRPSNRTKKLVRRTR